MGGRKMANAPRNRVPARLPVVLRESRDARERSDLDLNAQLPAQKGGLLNAPTVNRVVQVDAAQSSLFVN